MKKLALNMLILVALLAGCSPSSSMPGALTTPSLAPPSSQYLADIIGRVTVISDSIVKGGSPLPTLGDGAQFWVVQLFVRNKGYETPVDFVPGNWLVRLSSAQAPYDIGQAFDWVGVSSVTVAQGQEGQETLLFVVSPEITSSGGLGVTPSPKDCQLRYIGRVQQSKGLLQVDSFGSLEYKGAVAAVYDWDSQRVVQASVSGTSNVKPASSSKNSTSLKLIDIWGLDYGLLGAEIFAQFEATSTTKSGSYEIALLAGKEQFGTKTLYWSEDQEVGKVSWILDPSARPLIEIARGKTAKEVFQVKISFNSE